MSPRHPAAPRADDPTGTLADVLPALLASLGVAGFTDRLGLRPARAVCLLLVDGLGWQALREHTADAPFLASLLSERPEPIAAGFPSTTATSLASLGTGLPAGEHGIVGYTFATPDGPLINTLSWRTHGQGDGMDLRGTFVPEDVQPLPTALERAADDGVRVTLAAPHPHQGSGLSRAVLRGGEFRGVHALGDLTSTALAALPDGDAGDDGERALCYAYHADLDLLGHVYGPGSLPWRMQLAHIDRLVTAIGDGLPVGGQLVVTADHGMVTVPESNRLDYDTEPALQHGVRLLGGEPRARYLYTEPGATDDVLATWCELVGDRAWVLTRDEAVAHGWFGPVVPDRVRARIGDVIVAARADFAVVRSVANPRLSRLVGQHGSVTPAERLVPLLVFNPDE